MENNILSLFDEDNVPAQPNNKKLAAKKKANKKSQTTNNSLFSFDTVEADNEAHTPLHEKTPELQNTTNVAEIDASKDDVDKAKIDTENTSNIEEEITPDASAEAIDLFSTVEDGILPIDIHNDYDGIDIIVDVIPAIEAATIDPIVEELPTIEINAESDEDIEAPISDTLESTIDPIVEDLPTIEINAESEEDIEVPTTDTPESTIDPIVEDLPSIEIIAESEEDTISETPESTINPIIEALPAIEIIAESEEVANHNSVANDEVLQSDDNDVISELQLNLNAAKNTLKNKKAQPIKNKQKIHDLHKAIDEATGQQQLFHNADSVKYESLKFEITEPEAPVQSLPEWKLTKKYYTIGEVAQLFEVNTSHIRFWTKEFNFKLRTNRKGDRMYTPIDIDKLRMVHELVKVKRHTLKGAKDILNNKKLNLAKNITLKDNLTILKELLINIRASL